jgi:hypothetical protein
MATVANGRMVLSVHVFEELDASSQETRCELCDEQSAAYHWTEQDDRSTQMLELTICRVCAGTILLLGKSKWDA